MRLLNLFHNTSPYVAENVTRGPWALTLLDITLTQAISTLSCDFLQECNQKVWKSSKLENVRVVKHYVVGSQFKNYP